MKKFTKALTVLLIVLATATLVACNTFGKVQKALEEIGYKAVETSNDTAEDMENESEVAVTVHLFSNADSISVAEIAKINTVIVFEFKATKDMIEFYKDSDTMQGLLKDIREEGSAEEFYNKLVEEGYANGNCLVMSVNFLVAGEVREAIKNA